MLFAVGLGIALGVARWAEKRKPRLHHAAAAGSIGDAMTEQASAQSPDVNVYVEEGEVDVEQLSFEDAMEARNAVLDEQAEKHKGWVAIANAAFAKLPATWEGIGEDLRNALTDLGVPPPRHVNVWGVWTGNLVRAGLLVPTGEYRAMRAKGANARRSPVYVRATAEEQAA
jgi:hypothetical protein